MALGYTKFLLVITGVLSALSAVGGIATAFRGNPVGGLIMALLALAFIYFTVKEWPVVSACGTAAEMARARGIDI